MSIDECSSHPSLKIDGDCYSGPQVVKMKRLSDHEMLNTN